MKPPSRTPIIPAIYDHEFALSRRRHAWRTPRAGVFSCDNARNLMLAAYIAYARRDLAEEALTHFDFARNSLVWVENEVDAAYVASDGEHALIVVRGSDDARAWWENAHVSLTEHALGRVHGGVNMALQRLWEPLNREGVKLARQARYVWLTGHSRGGLIATLLAAGWRLDDVPFVGLYTFGSPQIGDLRFRRELEKLMPGRIHRVVNGGDWMAEMPPNPPYEHVPVGELTLLDDPRNPQSKTTPAERERRTRELLSAMVSGVLERVLGDHMPRAYIESLDEFCDAGKESS